jgi:pimeloyl-ACP methyl ester carboxylesterase
VFGKKLRGQVLEFFSAQPPCTVAMERQGRAPTIVMAQGFSAGKEMYLDRFAEAFAAAGLASVLFDNRDFGASDGEPRQETAIRARRARIVAATDAAMLGAA